MNDDERKVFWEKLCSLKEDSDSIKETIKYPRYLFRYRRLTFKSLEDIKNGTLTFSTSNYYDDPFDTYLRINKNKLKEDIEKIFQQENFVKIFKSFINKLGNEISEEQIFNIYKTIKSDDIYNFMLKAINENTRNFLRGHTLSACFSENGVNESLWIKYADMHKGFAIIYDPFDNSKFLCGKQDKCKECAQVNAKAPLYPVYYSDTPYDATEFAKWFTVFLVVNKNNRLEESIKSLFPKLLWEREKIILIKKECHKYDQEWRMIYSEYSDKPISIKWIPYGIILGLNMSQDDKDLVYYIAKIGGIENIFECFIDENDELNYRKYKNDIIL